MSGNERKAEGGSGRKKKKKKKKKEEEAIAETVDLGIWIADHCWLGMGKFAFASAVLLIMGGSIAACGGSGGGGGSGAPIDGGTGLDAGSMNTGDGSPDDVQSDGAAAGDGTVPDDGMASGDGPGDSMETSDAGPEGGPGDAAVGGDASSRAHMAGVAGGFVAHSASHTLVSTLGQGPASNITTRSSTHTFVGGVVGATQPH